jgi:hypothetical protein
MDTHDAKKCKGEQAMLAVTEAARTRLAQLLGQEDVSAEAAVRLVQERDGISLQRDAERPGDEIFQHSGRTVLVLDAQVSELLSDSTLDIDETGFALRHPEPDA